MLISLTRLFSHGSNAECQLKRHFRKIKGSIRVRLPLLWKGLVRVSLLGTSVRAFGKISIEEKNSAIILRAILFSQEFLSGNIIIFAGNVAQQFRN